MTGRRLLPWAACGLLAAAIVGGAAVGALGVPGQSASAWVAHLVGTTESAGTARVVTRTTITLGPQRRKTRFRGTGLLDFRNARYAVRITTTSQPGDPLSTSYVQVGIGRTVYLVVSPGPSVLHVREPRPINPLGVLSTGTPGAPDDLLRVPSSAWEVVPLGTARTRGAADRAYRLAGEPACASAPAGSVPDVVVWVDRQGRLVRVRTVARYPLRTTVTRGVPVRAPAERWQVVTETARLSEFGAPGSVTPPASPAPGRGLTSRGGSVTLRGGCPSS